MVSQGLGCVLVLGLGLVVSENRRFLLRDRHCPSLSYCLLPTRITHEPGKSRKLERYHSMNVKRRVRDDKGFSFFSHRGRKRFFDPQDSQRLEVKCPERVIMSSQFKIQAKTANQKPRNTSQSEAKLKQICISDFWWGFRYMATLTACITGSNKQALSFPKVAN